MRWLIFPFCCQMVKFYTHTLHQNCKERLPVARVRQRNELQLFSVSRPAGAAKFGENISVGREGQDLEGQRPGKNKHGWLIFLAVRQEKEAVSGGRRARINGRRGEFTPAYTGQATVYFTCCAVLKAVFNSQIFVLD